MKKLLLLMVMVSYVAVDQLSASVVDLRPVDETFVLDPGTGSPFANAANHNYGGSGSRCISARQARAYSVTEGLDEEPKGLFESILKFDSEPIAGMQVTSVELSLNISNGNRSAFDIFNYLGHSGTFGVYLMTNSWQTGWGTPSSDTTSSVGVTYNSLQTILAADEPVLLDTFYYDGANPYGSPEMYTFSISLENETFISALNNGDQISLLLSPEDDQVCFNFTSYIQQNADPSRSVIRDAGATLSVTVPEPSILTLMTISGIGFLRNRRSSRE